MGMARGEQVMICDAGKLGRRREDSTRLEASGGIQMAGGGYFTRDSLRFLEELRQHNERDWFQKNKERYERTLRDPFLRLIGDLGPPLKKIGPNFVADPRPVGGSMMRIYRDIRFSRDKSPYKTFVAAHFRHAKGKDGAAPGYYLRIEPGRSMVGAGIWRPEPQALKQIRDAIVADPKRWQRITSGQEFRSTCGMAGESLKRPPLGYDPDHPLIEALKRKDFATSSALEDRQVCGPDLMDAVISAMRTTAPFVQFLAQAVGLP
jgi:uncharacterized protein (TIGR02453 family)